MKKPLLILSVLITISYNLIGQITDLNFSHDGLARESKLFIPDDYDGDNDYPLLLLLHGLGGNGENMLNSSGFTTVSNSSDDPFIILSPTATFQEFLSATEWNEGINPVHEVDDISYLNALIDSVESYYNINPDRIYCTGFSDGGFMTNRLSCEMNDRIAAFASVGGTRASSVNCDPDRGTPVLHIHGTADQVVGYDGDLLFGSAFLASLFIGVDDLIFDWLENNNCVSDVAAVSLGNDTEVYKYTACDDQSEVWLYKVNDGDHSWVMTPDFLTPELIWEFFSQFEFFVGVDEENLRKRIVAYPNPSSSGVFQLKGIELPVEYQIFSSMGKLIEENVIQSDKNLDLSQYPSGAYNLILYNESSQPQTLRLIIP